MDKDYLSKVSAVALNGIFGYEPKFSHRIIDELGSPEAVFSLSREELGHVFGPCSKYIPLINGASLEKAAAQLERLESEGCSVLGICDDGYPQLLKECEDAPMALYVRSGTDPGKIFNGHPSVSVVGTRDLSPYGREWCTRIIRELAKSPLKPVIVSGLAMGIDITAHMAALACGLPTVAVLPVGIDDVYPRRHSVAAHKISHSPGSALITDYPPGTAPVAFNFIRRNRIIAGLSRATILVESKSKGGGTMTARLAFEYGRDVYALPGRIDDIRSEGCNRLVREKVAETIDSLGELVRSLGLECPVPMQGVLFEEELQRRYGGSADADNIRRIALAIRRNRGMNYDELCRECGMGYDTVARLAATLENDGFIETDPVQRCSINSGIY